MKQRGNKKNDLKEIFIAVSKLKKKKIFFFLVSAFYFYYYFFNFYFYFILLYNTVLVLPYIDMNPPRVYMRSQT